MSDMNTEPKPSKRYGGRNEILGRSGRLAEAEVDVDGVTYIVRELTGLERAHVLGIQASARLKGTVDVQAFDRLLLLYGVCDPESAEGAREPAFVEADMDTVLKNGAGFLEKLTERIEQLSGLSVAVADPSDPTPPTTPNGPSTSGSPAS